MFSERTEPSTAASPVRQTAKLLVWAFIGPALSIVAGFAAFAVFAFVLGPGIDIDNKGAPIEKMFDAAALPALYGISFVGTLVCWVIAIGIFQRR